MTSCQRHHETVNFAAIVVFRRMTASPSKVVLYSQTYKLVEGSC